MHVKNVGFIVCLFIWILSNSYRRIVLFVVGKRWTLEPRPEDVNARPQAAGKCFSKVVLLLL